MITFICTACQKKLSVKDELAGKKGKCPGCGQAVAVPGAARPVDATDAVTVPPPDHSDPTREVNAGDAGSRGELTDFLSPPQSADELGRLGKYRVLEILGRGGMGVVYKAEDTRLMRIVALKVMLPSMAASPSAGKRFLREARAMAAVKHDNIATIHQADEERGVPYLAMELLAGEPLDQRLDRPEKLTLLEIVRIGREMAEGLAAAHATGLIHRDIKPANVWLESPRRRVKILDFGLARASSEDSGLTQQGAIMGTPAYMAPEQARGETVDPRCDLFSLGVVLYRMCCGRQPFKGKDSISTLMEVATHDPPPPAKLNPDVPSELSALVMKLLEKEPTRRPASANEVATALQTLERKLARRQDSRDLTEAVPVGPEPQKPSRMPWIVAVVLVAGGIVVGAYFLSRTPRDPAGNGGGPEDRGKAFDAWVKEAAALPSGKQLEAVSAKLEELNPDMASVPKGKIEGGVVTELTLSAGRVSDISAIRALPQLRSLRCSFLIGQRKGKLSDLSPLKGMKLTSLHLTNTRVSDLSPIADLPLTRLLVNYTLVSDLSPLRDMKLVFLSCDRARVSDLSPLKDMPLAEIWCDFPLGRDAEILRSIKTLKTINGKPAAETFNEVDWINEVSAMPGLKQSKVVMEKLRKLNPDFSSPPKHKTEGGKLTELEFLPRRMKDLSPIRALTGLRSLRLGFHQKGNSPLSDISPVRSLRLATLDISGLQVPSLSVLEGMGLTTLDCERTPVADLSPLRGMKLTYLNCVETAVTDLTPLVGMPLKELWCDFNPRRDATVLRSITTLERINGKPAADFWKEVDAKAKFTPEDAWLARVAAMPAAEQVKAVTARLKDLNPDFDGLNVTYEMEDGVVTELRVPARHVTDISPVRALPGLRLLTCNSSTTGNGRLADLSPLRGMRLTHLNVNNTKVSDLRPLAGMKTLSTLRIRGTEVADLSPLEGSKLSYLMCSDAKVTNLAPIKGLSLKSIHGDFKPERDATILRAIKTLQTINGKPTAKFLEENAPKKR